MTCTALRTLLLAARRRLRRIFEVRFLGTPMTLPSLPFFGSSVQLDVFQLREPYVHHFALAATLALVEVLPTYRAQALTVFFAHHRHRQRQQYLLSHDRVQIDRLAVERFGVDLFELKAARPL